MVDFIMSKFASSIMYEYRVLKLFNNTRGSIYKSATQRLLISYPSIFAALIVGKVTFNS
jgi:hypothetical protein